MSPLMPTAPPAALPAVPPAEPPGPPPFDPALPAMPPWPPPVPEAIPPQALAVVATVPTASVIALARRSGEDDARATRVLSAAWQIGPPPSSEHQSGEKADSN